MKMKRVCRHGAVLQRGYADCGAGSSPAGGTQNIPPVCPSRHALPADDRAADHATEPVTGSPALRPWDGSPAGAAPSRSRLAVGWLDERCADIAEKSALADLKQG
jgi:hypothetical protein